MPGFSWPVRRAHTFQSFSSAVAACCNALQSGAFSISPSVCFISSSTFRIRDCKGFLLGAGASCAGSGSGSAGVCLALFRAAHDLLAISAALERVKTCDTRFLGTAQVFGKGAAASDAGAANASIPNHYACPLRASSLAFARRIIASIIETGALVSAYCPFIFL